MPKDSVISSGKTTNEAIENGLKILKVSKNMVNVKVLESDRYNQKTRNNHKKRTKTYKRWTTR